MPQNDELTIRISAELGDLRNQLNQLRTQLQNTSRAGQDLSQRTTQGVEALNNSLRTAVDTAKSFTATIGLSFSAAAFANINDQAVLLNNTIKLVTNSAQEFLTAQQHILSIAQKTGSSIQDVANTYSLITKAAALTNANQADVLKLTQAVSTTIALDGEQAVSNLENILGGLAAGAVSADDFEEALKTAFTFTQQIAKGLNISTQQLIALAGAGKVTSDAVLTALLKQSDEIDKLGSTSVNTIAQGFSLINNQIVSFAANSEDLQKAGTQIGNVLNSIAEIMPSVLNALVQLGPAILAVNVAFASWSTLGAISAGIAASIGALTLGASTASLRISALIARMGVLNTATLLLGVSAQRAWASFTAGLASGTAALLTLQGAIGTLTAAFAGFQIGQYLSNQFVQVRQAGVVLVIAFEKISTQISGAFKVASLIIKDSFQNAFSFITQSAISTLDSITKTLSKIPQIGNQISEPFKKLSQSLSQVKTENADIASEIEKVWQATEDKIREIDQIGFEMFQSASGKTIKNAQDTLQAHSSLINTQTQSPEQSATEATQAAARAAQRNTQIVSDNVAHSLAQIKRLYDEGQLSTEQYFAKKTQYEQQAIDAQIQQAQTELKASQVTQDQEDILTKITLLQRARKDAALDAIQAQAEAEEKLNEQMEQVRISLLQATGNNLEASKAQLENQYRNLIAKLQVEGRDADVTIVRHLIDTQSVNEELSQLESKVSEVTQSFQIAQTAAANEVTAGITTITEGEERIQNQRKVTIKQLEEIQERLSQIRDTAEQSGNSLAFDKANTALSQVNSNIADLKVNTNTFGQQAKVALTDNLTNFFTNLASGTMTALDAIKNFAQGFVQSMAQIAARMLATQLVMKLFKGMGGIGGGEGNMLGGLFHTGGIVGQQATFKPLPAFAFVGAPRYKTGGIAGLSPDEVPAILHKGEEVLTQSDPRHRNNQGNTSVVQNKVTTPVVVFGENELANALAGRAGEKMVITHVKNNPSLFK